jgi:flotillin
VAQEQAEKAAEEARAEREAARLKAEVVVPADAQREKVLIAADAEKQQSIRIAEGQAAATLAKMQAEGKGVQAILDGKAEGYKRLVAACQSAQQVAALLLIEKLTDVAGIQAQAIQDLPIEKIVVWDGGGGDGGGMSGLGGRLMGALPPMHELARQVGLDLPDFLGKVAKEAAEKAPGRPAKPPTKARKADDEGPAPEVLKPAED